MSRRSRLRSLLACIALLGLLAGSSTSVAGPAAKAGGGFASILDTSGPGSVDARSGSLQPTAEQLRAVASLGAHAIWNDYGTPQSLIRYGGHLATGIQGANAAEAARSFVDANKGLFRLGSTENLAVVNDAPVAGSDGYAVVFAQEFGGLRSVEGGLLTVGIEGSPERGWSVAYASSGLTGDAQLAASPSISPTEAWTRAAADVGREVAAGDIHGAKQDGGWSVFVVEGFSHPQRARLVALPTPLEGVRPAWEVLLVDGRQSFAFHSFVDAANGAVLVRKNLVHNNHPPGETFAGQVPPADAACAPDEGPWTVAPGETVEEVQASAGAVLTTNDIVLHIVRNGAIVASQDTGTSPETVVYTPADDGVGTYTVRVCDFADGAGWGEPRDYSGQVAFSEAGPGTATSYPPKWNVFPANPNLGNQTYPWAYPSNDTRELWCWESTVGPDNTPVPGCDREVQNLASRVPWDYDPRLNAPTFTTKGNNAVTAESWGSPLTPGPTGFRPVSASRNYDFPWTNQWFETECLPTFVPGVTQDVSAATVNLFAQHNRMHDWSYFLGFTERHWNAQDSNFGTGGTAERDPLLGDVQAGAVDGGFPSYTGRDNANMIPLPDGVPPVTNMYLWQPVAGAFYAPCVDGDFDMAVIGHEYGHLIESRMIGKGGSRSGHHAGAMGESFGDFDAAEYLNEYGFVPVDGENPFAVGAYVTANKDRAIRNYNMSWNQTGAFPQPGQAPQVNPLNFSDFGYDIVGQQVHANGEIWSATNFDIRKALVQKYNGAFPAGNAQLQADCADGRLPPNLCPGNRRWIQIVYDAMLLMPPDTSMVEARDAYLAADVMRFGGANQAELWLAFARRGFGQNATSTNLAPEGTPASDSDPKPDFESPHHDEAVVTFSATAEEDGASVPARIFVGHYEARVSPIADTAGGTGPPDGTETPGFSNLDNRAGFVPGTYEFIVQADGYGAQRFRLDLSAGPSDVVFELPTNWASKHQGAAASGDGTAATLPNLIDDTEGTNWDDPSGGSPVNTANPQVTVDLAGDEPQLIDRVNVSAMLDPIQTVTGPSSENRFTALRQFRIEVSTNGATFAPVFTSAEDAFPGFNPRPVGPEMILRTFQLPSPVEATHVRIVVLDNQCTGDTDFQGTQDADPANPTDCTIGAPPAVAERDTEVHIAELQAFGPPPTPPAPEADLSVTKTDSQDPAIRGQEFDYVIIVTNGGPETATGVTLTDFLPKGAGFSRAVTTKGSCSAKGPKRTVTCTLGNLAPAEVVTVTITVKPTDHGTIVNTVTVSAQSPSDPNPANNEDTETTQVT
jgi:extracellular elastinolytic metalloproteinase